MTKFRHRILQVLTYVLLAYVPLSIVNEIGGKHQIVCESGATWSNASYYNGSRGWTACNHHGGVADRNVTPFEEIFTTANFIWIFFIFIAFTIYSSNLDDKKFVREREASKARRVARESGIPIEVKKKKKLDWLTISLTIGLYILFFSGMYLTFYLLFV